MHATDVSIHGKWDYKYGQRSKSLDECEKALIRSHLENKESYRMQQLLQFLRKELPKCVPLPDEKNIRYFIGNERKR